MPNSAARAWGGNNKWWSSGEIHKGLGVTDPRSLRISNVRRMPAYIPQKLLEMFGLLDHFTKDPEGSRPVPIRN